MNLFGVFEEFSWEACVARAGKPLIATKLVDSCKGAEDNVRFR